MAARLGLQRLRPPGYDLGMGDAAVEYISELSKPAGRVGGADGLALEGLARVSAVGIAYA